ncbi:hypothetical protein AQ505_16260 [Pedobacter sp. PACM 27299]|nr:hypothetical protein AQ505_16260 [Pedobacter sp. PACM 27299]
MYQKSFLPYYQLFDHSPVSAAILDVDRFKLEMVNEKMLELWGRSASIINLPLLDVLPELANQEYPEILKQVAKTGELWKEEGARVKLNRGGQMENVYVDYSYTPIFNKDHKASAILVMATDVTALEINRLMVAQSERNLRTLVLSAPVPMCIYKGAGFQIEVVNNLMLELGQDWQRKYLPVLQHVYHNGVPYSFIENGFQYAYTPLFDGNSGITGVCLIASRVLN